MLDNLAKQTTRKDYKLRRLYRNLYKSEFYLSAYARIYSNEGNMTEGVDGQTIDGMMFFNVLRNLLKNLKILVINLKPSKRVDILKKEWR